MAPMLLLRTVNIPHHEKDNKREGNKDEDYRIHSSHSETRRVSQQVSLTPHVPDGL